MPVVERAHRGNQTHGFAICARGAASNAYVGNAVADFHVRMARLFLGRRNPVNEYVEALQRSSHDGAVLANLDIVVCRASHAILGHSDDAAVGPR
jgi:23S rRNA maturation mini-RNase III